MEWIKLLRIYQWMKNAFILAPLFFSGNLFEVDKIVLCFLAIIVFSLNASSIYVINDILDIESDKIHPTKRNRPLASGTVSKNAAILLFIALSSISLLLAFFINYYLFIVIVFYFVMNLFYSFGLKKIALLDIILISFGFVFRVMAGGFVSGIEISHWLYIMTFLLALFIAFAKRRDDIEIENKTGEQMRQAITGYNLEFISSAVSMLCGILVVSYLLYITSPEIENRFHNKPIYISTVFVVIGVLRYMQITLVEKKSGSPTKILLKDRFLQLTVVFWMLFFGVVIYMK